MSLDPRWRLTCSPHNDACHFVLSRLERTASGSLRLDCVTHFNSFLVVAVKKGVLRIDRTESISEPPKRAEAIT